MKACAVCSIYNSGNTNSTNAFGHFIVLAEQLPRCSVLEVQKKLCNLLPSSYISAAKGWKDVLHVSNHSGFNSASVVCCGSFFGFDICWMRSFGSVTLSSIFCSVQVLKLQWKCAKEMLFAHQSCKLGVVVARSPCPSTRWKENLSE